mgnify:FL=1
MGDINLLIVGLVFGAIIALVILLLINKSKPDASYDESKATDTVIKELGDLKGEIRTIMDGFGGKIKEENERSNANLTNTLEKITSIERTLTGTKSRGIAGEALLERYLETAIKTGEVKKNLNIGSKNVEFAWKVNEGKYIPIDAKLPDIFSLVEEYDSSDDPELQKNLSKKVKDKVAKEITNIQKYQNQPNTINNCILAVPSSILDMSPELLGIGKERNVYLSSYENVEIIAHLLSEQYHRFTAEGDIGTEKMKVEQLISILEKIFNKTDTIDKALRQISNANNEIKDEASKSRRI